MRSRDGGGGDEEVHWSGRGLAETADEAGPGAAGLASGDLLFEDGRDERVEHAVRPAQPHARQAMGKVGDRGMEGRFEPRE